MKKYTKTSLSFAMASVSLPMMGYADTSGEKTLELDTLTIEGHKETPYQTKKLSSPKYTQELVDTPQSITVVPRAVIEQQNAQTLQDVLSNVPGVTFNSGEGNGGVGDSINIRGFNSGDYGGSNVYIDGVRDSAFYTRTDMYNIEQVEVIKGSSSAAWGAGVIGGAINLVTKTPKLEDFAKVGAGVGTADYKRLTFDGNKVLDPDSGTAARLNMAWQDSGIDGRDWFKRNRWGIAPSISFGLNTNTRNTLAYEHLTDNGNYDYGIPTKVSNNRPHKVEGVKWDGYFGYRNLDREDQRIDRISWKFEHDFNDNISFNNQANWSQLQRSYIVTTPSGANASLRRLQGVARHTDNQTFSNQTNIIWKFDTLGVKHTLVTGMELTRQYLDYKSGGLRWHSAMVSNSVPADPSHPASQFAGNKEIAYTSKISADSTTKAFYVMDTLEFGKYWQLDLSARQDHYKARITDTKSRSAITSGGQPTGFYTPWQKGANDRSNEKLFSYRTALVFKPVEYGSIYASFSTAQQPQSIRIATSGSLGDDLSPTKGKSYELGTKWDLFNERLSLTAAIFRTKVDATDMDDTVTPIQTYSYKQKTDGVELGVSGNITDRWSVFAGYAYMDSKVEGREGWDDGITLPNTPRNSASLWTSYELPYDITVSYGVRYVGERSIPGGRGTSMSNSSKTVVPSYSVHDAAIAWQANKNLNLRLNINNIFNKHYWRQYNGRGFGLPGPGQGAQLTAEYSF